MKTATLNAPAPVKSGSNGGGKNGQNGGGHGGRNGGGRDPGGLSGRGNGDGNNGETGAQRNGLAREAAASQEDLGPQAMTGHYDSGVHYGEILYAGGDPTLPLAEGAKVKMELSRLSQLVMVAFIENHITMMTGNALYPTPAPAAADFLEQFTSFRNAVQACDAAETLWRNAVATRDAQRGMMVAMMNQRGAYVQTASNGNRQAIISSGLKAKNPPTPVNFLPSPGNLRVDLNREAGMVQIRWKKVPYARGYVLQYCRLEGPRVWEQLAVTTKTLVTANLEVGHTYVFRVAASGVPGQSNWSPEVIRGVA